MIEPNLFIKTLRESDLFIKYIYSYGGCYQLYKILKTIYPEAQPYQIDMNHVATMINGILYDIDGKVKDTGFKLMTKEEEAEANKWSFAGRNDLYFGECPICGQPITIDREKLL